MNCKKCGSKMFEEFENIRGKITVIWFCLKCDTEK